jgi:hypothetical protein
MIKYLEGNLFDFIDDHNPVMIAHVCNDQGAWGAGFVVPLGQKYPIAELSYRDWYSAYCTNKVVQDFLDNVIYEDDDFALGKIQVVQAKPHIYICNMVAQKLGGKRPLFYNKLCQCMDSLAGVMEQCIAPSLTNLICPQFGSGLAGGDWNVIEQLIYDCWVRVGIGVTVVRYKK